MIKRKEYCKKSAAFYKDYIQGRTIGKDENKFIFTKKGYQENSKWNPNVGRGYSKLVDDIIRAGEPKIFPNTKLDKKSNVSHYEVYRGSLGDHLIEVNNNGEKRYYTTKGNTPDQTARYTIPDRIKGVINNVNDFSEKINPPHG